MSIERNINLFYLYRFFWMGLYFLSILFVFYEARGLSFFEITTLGVVWSAFAFLLEVPTGILSDRWSRKYTLVLSSLFSIIMCLVFIYSQNYLLFVIATLFYALRDTFYSGTVNSLLYDSLQELGREKEFEKILGRSNFFHAFSLVIASIIGSYLVALGFSIPFMVSGIFMLLTFLVALLFVEPARVSDPGETSLVSHIKSSMKFMITNGAIRFYVIYLIFLTISLELVVEHDQFYLIAGGVPVLLFGWWFALKELSGGLTGLWIERLRNYTKTSAHLIGLTGIALSILLVALLPTFVGLIMIITLIFFSSFLSLIVNGEFNRVISSDKRATLGSLVAFFITIVDVPLRLFFGFIGNTFSIRVAYLYVFVLAIIYLIYFFFSGSKQTGDLE